MAVNDWFEFLPDDISILWSDNFDGSCRCMDNCLNCGKGNGKNIIFVNVINVRKRDFVFDQKVPSACYSTRFFASWAWLHHRIHQIAPIIGHSS